MKKQLTSYFMVNDFILLYLRSRMRQRCLLSPLLFSIKVEVLASTVRQEEEMKGLTEQKGRSKTDLFLGGIRVESSKESSKEKKPNRTNM